MTSMRISTLLAGTLVLSLVGCLAADCPGAIHAGAITDLSHFSDHDESVGETFAQAAGSGFEFIAGWNQWEGSASAIASGESTDAFLRTSVDVFTEAWRFSGGAQNGLAQAAWQDTIHLSGTGITALPSKIRMRVGAHAIIEFSSIGQGTTYGVANVDLFLFPSIFAGGVSQTGFADQNYGHA